jgi:malonate decarboxylase alpha subunit
MTRNWQHGREERDARIESAGQLAKGNLVELRDATRLLEAVIRPGDRVCLEGDNRRQADTLCAALLAVDVNKVNGLHIVLSGAVLPEHLDLFDRGVAKRRDFAYSGPQSARIAAMRFAGKTELGAVHTYLELFARYFIDLTPNVALIAAIRADRGGNLHSGPNTEDTPRTARLANDEQQLCRCDWRIGPVIPENGIGPQGHNSQQPGRASTD